METPRGGAEKVGRFRKERRHSCRRPNSRAAPDVFRVPNGKNGASRSEVGDRNVAAPCINSSPFPVSGGIQTDQYGWGFVCFGGGDDFAELGDLRGEAAAGGLVHGPCASTIPIGGAAAESGAGAVFPRHVHLCRH